MKEWLTLLNSPISWAIVIAGWYFVSRDHNKRECRKELRALLNEMRDLAHRVETNAVAYYSRGADDEASRLSMQIRRDVGYLGGLVANLKRMKHAAQDTSLESPLQELRQTVTGGDFDGAARAGRPYTDRLFADIATATLAFTQALEAMFVKTYPRT